MITLPTQLEYMCIVRNVHNACICLFCIELPIVLAGLCLASALDWPIIKLTRHNVSVHNAHMCTSFCFAMNCPLRLCCDVGSLSLPCICIRLAHYQVTLAHNTVSFYLNIEQWIALFYWGCVLSVTAFPLLLVSSYNESSHRPG